MLKKRTINVLLTHWDCVWLIWQISYFAGKLFKAVQPRKFKKKIDVDGDPTTEIATGVS